MEIATRLFVGIAYLIVAVGASTLWYAERTSYRLLSKSLSFATTVWGVWYTFLALADPSIIGWGLLNRTLHLVLVIWLVSFILVVRLEDKSDKRIVRAQQRGRVEK